MIAEEESHVSLRGKESVNFIKESHRNEVAPSKGSATAELEMAMSLMYPVQQI
jgi:hypothetical protein